MRTRLLGPVLGLLLAAASAAGEAGTAARPEASANAGRLDALAPDGRSLGACPLEHTDVAVEISGFVARVSVTQRFANPYAEPIEALYTFPLSERAAVDAMWMHAGERTIRGEILRRAEARAVYERARAAGQLAGILDEERPNVFTQSLANLMPGTAVEVHIEYNETLRYADGSFAFSFPTVVGPRFVPGGGRVPDASRIAPPVTPEGTRAGHDVAISLEIDAGVPIGEIVSALHEIDVERPSASRARVALRQRREIPNRDFALRWAVAADEVRSAVLAHRAGEGAGYATFVLVPPRRVPAREAAPKEMIFVVDRSGSQSGLPLLKAKETLLWILDHMNPQDTFQVVSFSNTAEWLFEAPQPASLEAKRRARAYVQALEANGGTHMAEAVREVASRPAAGNRLRIVTFMTDGYVGNDLELLSLVRELRGTSRWFPFGTGNSVNRFLLDGMARLGGGEAEYVLLNASGEEVARRFWERIASPVLTDVRVDFEGLDVEEVFPRELSDVWAERPLVIHARYRKGGRGRVVLRGFQRGEAWSEALEVALPEREERRAALASLWARAKVDALLARDLAALQLGQFPEALRREAEEIALAHRLLTPFTSFVAVEDRVVNEGGRQRSVSVPVEMPQGVTYEGVFGTGEGTPPGLPMPQAVGPATPAAESASGAIEKLRALGYVAEDASGREARPREQEALRDEARRKLAPALLALLRGEAPAAELDLADGEVLVRVRLKNATAARVEALERAGLRVRQRLDGALVGRIAPRRLGELAGLEFIEAIEPA